MLGVLFLAMLQNGLNLLGVSSYFFGVVIGLAILVSIMMTGYAEKRCAAAAHDAGGLMERPGAGRSSARPRRLNVDRLIRLDAARHGSGLGGLLALLATLVVFFSLLEPTTFPRVTTLQAMMFQLPELGLLSLAMAIPLISGGINLAIIATANSGRPADGLDPDRADASRQRRGRSWRSGCSSRWLRACCCASIVGLVTGLLVAVARRPSDPGHARHHDAAARASASISPAGAPCRDSPMPLIAVSNETILGVPISFILFMVVASLVHVLLTRTALGIRIHMIGSNPEATRYLGRRYPRACWSRSICFPACSAGWRRS